MTFREKLEELIEDEQSWTDKQLANQIISLIQDEVIGEDSFGELEPTEGSHIDVSGIKNQLRAEQRLELEEEQKVE